MSKWGDDRPRSLPSSSSTSWQTTADPGDEDRRAPASWRTIKPAGYYARPVPTTTVAGMALEAMLKAEQEWRAALRFERTKRAAREDAYLAANEAGVSMGRLSQITGLRRPSVQSVIYRARARRDEQRSAD